MEPEVNLSHSVDNNSTSDSSLKLDIHIVTYLESNSTERSCHEKSNICLKVVYNIKFCSQKSDASDC